MDISKRFFTDRMVRGWNRLPGEAVETRTLEGFKRGMEVAPQGHGVTADLAASG